MYTFYIVFMSITCIEGRRSKFREIGGFVVPSCARDVSGRKVEAEQVILDEQISHVANRTTRIRNLCMCVE